MKVLTQNEAARLMPPRRFDDHKGNRGGVLILAGSRRYRGAALLAARGALRMGAGLVVLLSVPEVLNAVACSLPEAIAEEVNTPEDLLRAMKQWSGRCSVLLAGSGLDRDERAEALCRAACTWQGPSLWDGDGLYWLAERQLRPEQCAVTPHEGEAARLLSACGVTPKEAASLSRQERAERLADVYSAVLLKGWHSLSAQSGRETLMIPRGDRTLSIPGSGDVLAGAAAALAAAGTDLQKALALAAWCHGSAGETLGRQKGQDGVLAHEVADALPCASKELNEGC